METISIITPHIDQVIITVFTVITAVSASAVFASILSHRRRVQTVKIPPRIRKRG
jgi:hypothetical protein